MIFSNANNAIRSQAMADPNNLLNDDLHYSPEFNRGLQSNQKKRPKTENLIQIQSENVHVTSLQFYKLKIAAYICFSLSLTGIGCAVISYDLNYTDTLRKDKDETNYLVFLVGNICTFLLLIAIVWRTFRELSWQQSKNVFSYQDTIFTTKKYQYLIVELVANFIHPFYSIREDTFEYYNAVKDTTIHYQVNALLAIFTLVRLYHMVYLLSLISAYRSTRTQRLCQINGSYCGLWFAIKCMMQEIPFKLLAFLMLSGLFVFGFCLRIFERPLSAETGKDFSDYENVFWCLIVTMTTVGYGDYFPITAPGRLVGFIACLWGALVVSLMVVALTNLFIMDIGEQNCLVILRRLKFKEELRDLAAFVLTSALRYRYIIKHQPENSLKQNLQLGKFRNYYNQFLRFKAKKRVLYDFDSFNDRIERKLVEVIENNDIISEKLNELDELMTTLEQGK